MEIRVGWKYVFPSCHKFACAHAAQAHPFPLQEKDAKVHLGGEAVYKTRRTLMLLPLRTPSMHAIA